MSTKTIKKAPKHKAAARTSTEKARKAAIPEIKQRLGKEGVGEISEAVSLRDHDSVTLVVQGPSPAAPSAADTRILGTRAAKRAAVVAPLPQAGDTAVNPKPPKAPKEKKAKAAKEPKPKRVSGLDAAAQVLAGAGHPMNARDLVAEMTAKGLWSSPKGKTPHATIYSAILREITTKGKESRFVKADRGLFAAPEKGA